MPEALANNETRLRLNVSSGNSATIRASTNLIDWQSLLRTSTSITHTDTVAGFVPFRYYRAEEIPGSVLAGDLIPASDGDILIRSITHASFLMTWRDGVIYNDPDTANYTGFPKADIILVGHEHGDHFDAATISNLLKPGGKIITTQTVYNQLSTTLKASTIVMTNGTSTSLAGITPGSFGMSITAMPAYNSNHPKGLGNGYVITLGGKRIYISGDTGDIPETRALQNIDVAFLCMNVPFTMTVQQAASVTRAFAPKVVYPYHYRNQDGTLANVNTFKSLVGTDLPIEVRFRKWY